MKKKVLYVFTLILYLLAVCTLLSQKIELEMTLPVTVKRFPGKSAMGGLEVPGTALFLDEAGDHLYRLVEGSDWESGLRIQEFTGSKTYTLYNVFIEAPLNSVLVLSAPRQPQEGALAEAVELEEHVPSRYLLTYPEGVPDYEKLPPNTQVSAQSGSALLLETEDGIRPFMEHKVKSTRTETYGIPGPAGLSALAGENWRVFCLEDVEQFLENLPALGLLMVLLAVPVLLGLFSGFLLGDPRKNRPLLLANVLICGALLYCLREILGRIDLPASLLPVGSILDPRHYSREFSVIIRGLETLGEAGQGTLALFAAKKKAALTNMTVGLLLVLAVILTEGFLALRGHALSRRRRYVGKYLPQKRKKGRYLPQNRRG